MDDDIDQGISLTDAADEVERLTIRIIEARDAYYGRDTVVVDDATYDELDAPARGDRALHPELQGQDSPTLTVGGRGETTLFAPVEHAERMLSLDNVFSDEEFLAWAAKVERDAGRPRALPLRAQDRRARAAPCATSTAGSSRPRPAATAGWARTSPRTWLQIAGIPHEARRQGAPALVEVRGEVFFNVADFESLNAYQEPMGDRLFANPRNAASGSLRQKTEGKNAAAARRHASAARRACA